MNRLYCHTGGRTLAYLDSAPGDLTKRVCMLLHAFPLGAGMWAPQLREAPSGWRLIACDLRGFGGSTETGRDEAPVMADYADDCIDLLRELGVARAVVGGLSMGGYAAFEVIRRAPGLIEAVVLADTRAGADTPQGRESRRQMIALVDRDGPAAVADDMLPRLIGPTSHASRPDVGATVRRLILQQTSAAVRGAILRMMTRADSTPLLRPLAVPALVIVGEEDELTPVEESRRIAGELAGSRLVVLPRAGHLSNLEVPELFTRALAEFLKGL